MNILYVMHSLDVGGAEKITIETALEMKKRGHNVYIYAPEGPLSSFILENKLLFIKCNINIKRKNIYNFMYLFITLYMSITKLEIDIVHTIHRWLNFVCFIVASLTNTKLIWTDHAILCGKRLLTTYKDKVISVSNVGKAHLRKYFGIPDSKIKVIHNCIYPLGVPSEEIVNRFKKEISISENANIISNISRLSKEKGQIYLLQAMPEVLLAFPNTHLLIAGEGGYKKKLIKTVDALGIKDNVHFLGERTDINTILWVSNILVLSSLNENLPLVILEAFSLGKVVIATDVGGVKEVISNNETGILIKPKDCKMLSIEVINMLSDKQKIRRIGNKAKVWYSEYCDFSKMVDDIENIYREVLGR